MKTFLARLLSLLFLLSPPAWAGTPFTYTTNNGTLTITRYTLYPGGATVFTIPAMTNGLLITGIGPRALSALYSVSLPWSITNLAPSALGGNCSFLTNITVEASNPVFSSLEGVLFDKNQTTLIQFPGNRAGSYTLPDSVTSLADSAFAYNGPLTNLTLNSSLATIGASALLGCWGLTSLTLPNGVVSIGDSAFEYATLSQIVLSTNLLNIPDSAFYGCSRLASITIPDNVTNVGNSAFYQCSALTNIVLGPNVTRIGDSAFYQCSKLASITIPDQVRSLGDSVFYQCSGLTQAHIGSGVRTMGTEVFYRCSQLLTVELPAEMDSIGSYAFYRCSLLHSATLPHGLTELGDSMFSECRGLTQITIPDGVTNLGPSAFNSCTSLRTVNLPASLTNNVYAFWGCSSLEAITVDATNPVYSSVDGVLFDKSQTTLLMCPDGKQGSYTLPRGTTSIGVDAFAYCPGLTAVCIPNTVTNIGSPAFFGCSGLTGVFFQGDMPATAGDLFFSTPAIVYYLPGTKGWTATYGGVSPVLWNPQFQSCAGSGGGPTQPFGLRITGTTNIPVVVEACADLVGGPWAPLQSCTLTNGAVEVTDPQWTNYPARFYRLRSP